MQKLDIIKQSLEQVKRWRCPPHWQPDDWWEEMIAVAWAALWEGLNSGIRSEGKLRQFVITALMRRYREEWNYGARWVQKPNQREDEGDGEGGISWDLWDWVGAEFDIEDDEEEINFLRMVIRQALAQLPEKDRYLIERKFWDGATERELAKELGISQPAVNRRLKQILAKLQKILS